VVKNKIIASLIAGVFIISAVFYLPVLQFLQFNIKSEMQELISKENAEITVLDLTSNEFDKIKWLDADEFILDNVLYDLVSLKKDGGHITIKAVGDKKEANVIERMKEQNSKKCPAFLFQILSQYSHNVTLFSFSRTSDQLKFNLELPIQYTSLIIEKDSPPPKLMF
jgi:hypothetical protein